MAVIEVFDTSYIWWFPRESIPTGNILRGSGQSCRASSDLALEATRHHFHHTLLVRSKSQGQPRFKRRGLHKCGTLGDTAHWGVILETSYTIDIEINIEMWRYVEILMYIICTHISQLFPLREPTIDDTPAAWAHWAPRSWFLNKILQ